MILEVKEAKYLGDYEIELLFNDGAVKKIDLKDELDGEVFEPLKNKEYFKSFFIDCGTVSWGNGADIAPEYLYLKSVSLDGEDSKELGINKMVYELYNATTNCKSKAKN